MLAFGSLFAGIGGFDVGFERAGLRCLWQVEIDPTCNRVLARHWPKVRRYGDIRELTGDGLGAVDVLCGGFPCQDVSVAGKREGLAGERSGLWSEFARLVGELHPRWVVIENVCGLLSSASGRDFATILRGLVKRGYGVAYRVLDAKHFGVAQRRRRVFVVASLGDGRAAQVLFESEGGGWHPAPSREAGQGVAASLTAGSHGPGSNGPGRRSEDDVNLVAATLKQRGRGACDEVMDNLQVVAHALTSEGADASEDGTGRGVPLAFNWQSGGNCRLGIHEQPDALQACQVPAVAFTERSRRDGRNLETQDELAYALTNPGSGGRTQERRLQQGYMVRRLTPTECERLQGFPDGHTAGESDSARYRMLGNAVAVPVAEWIARRILLADTPLPRAAGE